MMALRRAVMIGGIVHFVEDTATGNPCVFTTDLAKPLRKLELSLLPRQSGTGDPSPSNIRPLLPWGEVGTWTGGKNLLQVTAESATKNGIVFTVNADGSVVANGTATGTSQLLLNRFYFAKGVAYKFNGIDGGSNQTYRIAVVYYTDDGTYITEQAFVNGDNSLVIPQNAEYADIYIRFYTGVTANNIVVSPMIRFASTDDAFVPYTPITPHPVNVGNITPPVYGASIDLTTGEVWGTYISLTRTWGDFSNKTSLGDNTRGTLNISSNPSKPSIIVTNAKCNVAPWKTGWSTDSNHFYTNEGSCIVFLPNDTDASTEIQVVYPLATPVLLATLTPQQILAIVGVNTVWSDADNVELTFLKKG